MGPIALAIFVPLTMLAVWLGVETWRLLQLRKLLTSVAYETARVAVRTKATTGDAVKVGQQFAERRELIEASIAIIPRDLRDHDAGQPVTVRVWAPVRRNVGPNLIAGNRRISSARVVMAKE